MYFSAISENEMTINGVIIMEKLAYVLNSKENFNKYYQMVNIGTEEEKFCNRLNSYSTLFENLQKVHDEGFINYNLKPDNIGIDINGNFKFNDYKGFIHYGIENGFSTPNFNHPLKFNQNNKANEMDDIWSLVLTVLMMESQVY